MTHRTVFVTTTYYVGRRRKKKPYVSEKPPLCPWALSRLTPSFAGYRCAYLV